MATSNSNTERVRLSRSKIDRFKCPEGKKEAYLWDDLTACLGIRAYASGKKSYVFRATINGKTQKATIGKADGDLEAARKDALKLLSNASQGVTPAQVKQQRAENQKREETEKKRHSLTLQQLWDAYLNANKDNWSERHYQDHLKAIQEPGKPCGRGLKLKTKAGALWTIRELPVSELSPSNLTNWLEAEKRTRPGAAALAYRLLFACLNWSTEQPSYSGLVDVNALKTRTVKRSVPKLKPRSGVLEREQLPAWFSEMRRIQNPVIAAFAQLLLITGARRGELESLKWEDVDLQWHSLTIRDKATTSGQEIGTRVIPLTQYACSLIQALPRRNEWVFSSPTSASGQMKEPRKSIDPALIAAGLDGLTLHDLRRSFATLSEWVEVPAGITAQIMGHKPSATAEKHYKRRPLDLLRKWHNRIEAWVLLEAGIPQPEYTTGKLSLVGAKK